MSFAIVAEPLSRAILINCVSKKRTCVLVKLWSLLTMATIFSKKSIL